MFGLRRVGRSAQRLLVGRLADLDITPDEFQVLLMVANRPGAISAVQIAEALGWEPPFVSRLVNGLAQRRLLARRRGRKDRRVVRLRTTPNAQQIIDAGRAAVALADQELTAGLTRTDRLAWQRIQQRLLDTDSS